MRGKEGRTKTLEECAQNSSIGEERECVAAIVDRSIDAIPMAKQSDSRHGQVHAHQARPGRDVSDQGLPSVEGEGPSNRLREENRDGMGEIGWDASTTMDTVDIDAEGVSALCVCVLLCV